MPIGGESVAVQNPFIRYDQEARRTYRLPDDLPRIRPDPISPVLLSVLVQQLHKLNSGLRAGLRPSGSLRGHSSILTRIEECPQRPQPDLIPQSGRDSGPFWMVEFNHPEWP
jgi:hypothetical protein